MKRVALIVLLASTAWAEKPRSLSPVKMVGPAKTLDAACASAAPCGFTAWNEKTQTGIKPPKKPDCDGVIDAEHDPNAFDMNGQRQTLNKQVGDAEIQIAAVTCAEPPGSRGDERRYYAFVKRPDGWWRTATPLFSFSYNEKYCTGLMTPSWNDRPTHTVLGLAASLSCLSCSKNGDATSTFEMLLRFEPSRKSPVVYAPLVVGQGSSVEPHRDIPDDIECKATKTSVSMKETWAGDDALTLAGPTSWTGMISDLATGLHIDFGSGSSAPSTAGSYRFTR